MLNEMPLQTEIDYFKMITDGKIVSTHLKFDERWQCSLNFSSFLQYFSLFTLNFLIFHRQNAKKLTSFLTKEKYDGVKCRARGFSTLTFNQILLNPTLLAINYT
jgi:hypothetical protein